MDTKPLADFFLAAAITAIITAFTIGAVAGIVAARLIR